MERQKIFTNISKRIEYIGYRISIRYHGTGRIKGKNKKFNFIRF